MKTKITKYGLHFTNCCLMQDIGMQHWNSAAKHHMSKLVLQIYWAFFTHITTLNIFFLGKRRHAPFLLTLLSLCMSFETARSASANILIILADTDIYYFCWPDTRTRGHTLRTEIAFPLKEPAVLIKSLKAHGERERVPPPRVFSLIWCFSLATGLGVSHPPNCRKEDVYVGGAGKRLICWHATRYIRVPTLQRVCKVTDASGKMPKGLILFANQWKNSLIWIV
jgi:hypothetical protein